MKPYISALTICLSAVTFASPSHAENNKNTFKHIKISSTAHSSSHIQIIKGKTESAKKLPNIITTTSCAETHNPKEAEILANSLRTHLTAKKQDPRIIDDILFASQSAGVDFELMIVKAMIESDLGRLTTTNKSSARGVYQYIDSTWLTLLKRYGHKIGYGKYANAVNNEDSIYSRQNLLDLRDNTRLSALIKAYQTKDDGVLLSDLKQGEPLSATDHYIMHMMGASLARDFYNYRNNESDIILPSFAHNRFRTAARLNPAFFYDHNGKALNATDSYQRFHDIIAQKYDALRDIYARYAPAQDAALLQNIGTCALPTIHASKSPAPTNS